MATHLFRVFLSSPGDVRPERDRAKRVLEKLDAELRDEAAFEIVRWEDAYYTAAADFQSQISRPSECDAVVCILWKRLGTPLALDRYRRADGTPFGSGTEYEFEDAVTAARERRVPDIFVYRKTERATFDAETAALEQAQWQALHAFWEKWFRSAEGHFTAAFDTFGSTDEFEVRLEQHLRRWVKAKLARDVVWPPERGSPFRGLQPFGEVHADVFFGRRRAVERARALLAAAAVRGAPYLLILGTSGAGKSSLVLAGLVPRLKGPAAAAGVDLFRFLTVRPSELGEDPEGVLARRLLDSAALPELSQGDFGTPGVLAKQLADPDLAPIPLRGALDRAARQAQESGAYERPLRAQLLLFVDQLEELFALRPEARHWFVALLHAFADSGTAWVVTTLRSDSYPACQAESVLVSLKNRGAHFDLGPPGEAEIGEIIRGPAAAAGLAYEKDGDRELDRLLEAAARTPGSLPLLEFTLDELYKNRDRERNLLTLDAYDALGGLEGAIERRAEAVYSTLSPAARATLPRVLRAVVRVDDEGTVRRDYVDLEGLRSDADRRSLVDAFVEARLFTTGETDRPAVSVAHEALLTHWARARQHIEADRSDISLRAWLKTEADRWEREHRRSRTRLLERGLRLDEAAGLVKRRRDELPQAVVDFVGRSVAQARRRARILAAAGIAAVLLISIAGLFAAVQWRQAEAERRRTVAALAQSDFQEGTRLVEGGDAAKGLAYLARAMRGGSDAAAARAWDLLARRSWPRLAAPPLRHEWIQGMAFRPDGTPVVIVRAGEDTAEIRAGLTGEPAAKPIRQTGIRSASFSPDGSRILTITTRGSARVWDAATGEPVTAPMQHERDPTVAAFSPDNSRIFVASKGGKARVWDATTGQPVTDTWTFESDITSAMFSPDGSRILAANNIARVLDAVTGKLVVGPFLHTARVLSAAFSLDGTRVVTRARNSIWVWDALTGRLLTREAQYDGRIGIFSPDGSLLVTASLDTGHIVDPVTGLPSGEFLYPGVNGAAFDSNGARIVTWSIRENTARVWDVTGAPLAEPLRFEGLVDTAAFSQDGALLLTLSVRPSGDAAVHLWDAATGAPVIETVRYQNNMNVVAFSQDGTRIATGARGRTARVWDTGSGQPLTQPLRHRTDVEAVAVSPDGARVVTASADGARVWEAATGLLVAELPHEGKVFAAAFSPDGARTATGSSDATARVWDTESGRLLTELRHRGPVDAVAFSPDGARIVTGADYSAQVWDIATGTLLVGPVWHDDVLTDAAFSPDGRRIVTASQDSSARVWDAVTGGPQLEPLQHEESVESAAFSPDGARIVTASEDGTARVWDAANGTLMAEPLVHETWLLDAAFSPDGARIVTAASDGTTRIWDVPAPSTPPEWAPDLVEALAGYRLTEQGVVEGIPDLYERQADFDRRVAEATGDDPWSLLLRWSFAAPADRTISPLSKVTVREFVARRLASGTQSGLHEAFRADPMNEEVRRRLAAPSPASPNARQ